MSNDVPKPPEFPWKKGDQGSYSSLVIEVHVCKDAHGRIFSMHKLQDDTDRETALSWPSGGQEQVAFALLTETLRREALFGILVRMTRDRELPTRFAAMDPDARQALIVEMGSQLCAQINAVSEKMAEAAVEEALLGILRDHQ